MCSSSRARAEDARAVLGLKLRAFADEFRRYGPSSVPPEFDSLARQVRTIEELHVYKVLRDGELVAGACVVELGDGVFVLASLFVEPRHQGQGIGTEVVRWIEREYSQARRWLLETPYLSLPNQRLYERLGYRKIGERVPPWAEGSSFRLFEYEKLMQG